MFGSTPSGVMLAVSKRACCTWAATNTLLSGPCTERSIQALELAYSQTGGVLSERDLLRRLQMFCDQPISRFARWIVKREIVHFIWRNEVFVPGFQFSTRVLTVRAEVRQVLNELSPALDDWQLTTWFAIPNIWLADRAPVDAIEADLTAVLEAARAYRFAISG